MRHTRTKKKSAVTLMGDGTAQVELTQGQVAIIDANDARLVGGHKWHAVKARGTYYARMNLFHGGRWISYGMHRLLCDLPPDDPIEPDHTDGNGLNNRKDNLRLANGTIQKLNQRRYKSNTSGMTGVHLRQDGRWRASISVCGQKVSLGDYVSAADAIRCRKAVKRCIDLLITQVAPTLARKEAA